MLMCILIENSNQNLPKKELYVIYVDEIDM